MNDSEAIERASILNEQITGVLMLLTEVGEGDSFEMPHSHVLSSLQGVLSLLEQQWDVLNNDESIVRMVAKLDYKKQCQARDIIRTLKESQDKSD